MMPYGLMSRNYRCRVTYGIVIRVRPGDVCASEPVASCRLQ